MTDERRLYLPSSARQRLPTAWGLGVPVAERLPTALRSTQTQTRYHRRSSARILLARRPLRPVALPTGDPTGERSFGSTKVPDWYVGDAGTDNHGCRGPINGRQLLVLCNVAMDWPAVPQHERLPMPMSTGESC